MTDNRTVSWRLGMKKNLGNFENVNIEVEISDSAHPDETIRQASDRVWSAVEKEFTEKASKAWGDLGVK